MQIEAKPMSTDYNERVGCWTMPCIRESLPYIEKYIIEMSNTDPARFQDVERPFVVAEFGCATGFSSIESLATIIKTVKLISPKLPILIYLNDLPSNHHEIAINTVTNGLFGEQSGMMKPKCREGVYIYIAGKDFTKKVFPEGYVDFGFSNMAAATLPNFPSNLTNCYFMSTDKVVSTTDGQIWVESFRDFLTTFMKSRLSELKKGGLFLLVTQSTSLDPLVKTYQTKEEIFY